MLPVYERIKKLIFTPKAAWSEIENETTTAIQLFQNYLVFILAIPSIFGFLGWLFSGENFFASLFWSITSFVLNLLGIWVYAKCLLFFAQNFDCELDDITASKIACYSFTPVLVASIFFLIPPISWLVILGAYSFVILCVGISRLIQGSSEKLIGMMVSACITMLIIYFIVIIIAMSLCGFYTPFPA